MRAAQTGKKARALSIKEELEGFLQVSSLASKGAECSVVGGGVYD